MGKKSKKGTTRKRTPHPAAGQGKSRQAHRNVVVGAATTPEELTATSTVAVMASHQVGLVQTMPEALVVDLPVHQEKEILSPVSVTACVDGVSEPTVPVLESRQSGSPTSQDSLDAGNISQRREPSEDYSASFHSVASLPESMTKPVVATVPSLSSNLEDLLAVTELEKNIVGARRQRKPVLAASDEVIISELNDASRSIFEVCLKATNDDSNEVALSLSPKLDEPFGETRSGQVVSNGEQKSNRMLADDVVIAQTDGDSQSAIEVCLTSLDETASPDDDQNTEVNTTPTSQTVTVSNSTSFLATQEAAVSTALDDILTEASEHFFAPENNTGNVLDKDDRLDVVTVKQRGNDVAVFRSSQTPVKSDIASLLTDPDMEASFEKYVDESFATPCPENTEAIDSVVQVCVEEAPKPSSVDNNSKSIDFSSADEIRTASTSTQSVAEILANDPPSMSLNEPRPAEKQEMQKDCTCIIL